MLTRPSLGRTGALASAIVGFTLSLSVAWAQESQDRPDRRLRDELRVVPSSVQQIALPAGLPGEFTLALEHGRTASVNHISRHRRASSGQHSGSQPAAVRADRHRANGR